MRALGPTSRSKILFVGDPHGAFAPIVDAVRQHKPQAIILLGDLQPRKPLHIELASVLNETEVWFIHGNHDTDSDQDFDNLFGSNLSDRNLHGRVATIGGYRIAGLGGVFRQKIWDPAQPIEDASFKSRGALLSHVRRGQDIVHSGWRGGFARKHHSSIFPDEIEALSLFRADILVTHEAPSVHPRGFRVLDDLAMSLGAKLVVHGHHHESRDYVRQGLMGSASTFRAFGVNMGQFLSWPEAELSAQDNSVAQGHLARPLR